MHRKFIALILSAAICVTGLSAIPAHAGQQDNGRLITGLAALAILGLAIHNSRDRDHHATVTQPVTQPPTPNAHSVRPRPLPKNVARFDLPRKCMRNHKLHGGPARLLGLQCLKKNYRYTAQLPYACRLQFGSQGFSRTGYEPLCLRERGYRIVNK